MGVDPEFLLDDAEGLVTLTVEDRRGSVVVEDEGLADRRFGSVFPLLSVGLSGLGVGRRVVVRLRGGFRGQRLPSTVGSK